MIWQLGQLQELQLSQREFLLLCRMDVVLKFIIYHIRNKPLLSISCLFIASRVLFFALGLRFNLEFMEDAPHCIDLSILTNRLWESIWYMHGQPPVFNLYVGLVMKYFPKHYVEIFHLVYLTIGYLHTIVLYKLMRQLNLGSIVSFISTLCISVSSATLLYENWLFYSYVEVFILSVSAYLLSLFLHKRSHISIFIFFLSLSLLVLTRSMFHLLWFAFIAGGMYIILEKERLKIIKAAFVPLLFVLFWYGKNYMLYDKFTASTWLGMNISRIAEPVKGIAEKPAFDTVNSYYVYVEQSGKYSTVPLLHNLVSISAITHKKMPNYYHIDYIQANDLFLEESVKKITAQPVKYLQNVVKAHILFFEPVTEHWWMGWENRFSIQYYSIFCDFRLPNLVFFQITGKQLYHSSLPAFILFCFVLSSISFILYKHLRKKGTIDQKHFYLIAYMLFNIIYVTVVSNWLELGENNRFRFTITAYIIILLTYVLDYFYKESKYFNGQKSDYQLVELTNS